MCFLNYAEPETAAQTVETAAESIHEPDHIFAKIDAHVAAYRRLDIAPPVNDEQLLEYFRREQEEIGAQTELVRWPPKTIAGARALLAYTARSFRFQSWDDEMVTAVLENVLRTMEQPLRLITAASSRDPIFSAIRAHARVEGVIEKWGDEDLTSEILEDETAACYNFSLTVPTTTGGVIAMISYALSAKQLYVDGKDGGKSAAIAAMLASLLRSPVLNHSRAKAAA